MNRRSTIVPVLIDDVGAKMKVHIWEAEEFDKTLFCFHGFAGTGQDFEILARTLVKSGFRVVAPDLIGRGDSTFLGDPDKYSVRSYLKCFEALSIFRRSRNYFLGSSWGGAIMLAYLAVTGWQTNGVILNDIPLSSNDTVQGYRDLLAQESLKTFETKQEAIDHLISSRKLGFLRGADLDRIIDTRIMKVGDFWRMKYDPATAQSAGNKSQFSLEKVLRSAPRPTLMTYGAQSPYFDAEFSDELTASNPLIEIISDMDDPHPPSLMKQSQVLQVAGYLGQLT